MPQYVIGALVKAIITIVISYAVNRVVQALAPKPKTTPTSSIPPSRDVTVRGTIEYRQLIYGQIVTGGFMAFFGTSGTNNQYLWFVIAYAGHECTAIDDLYLDARLIEDGDIDGTTHLVTTSTFAGDSSTAPGSKLAIWKHLGTSTQAVDAQLAAAFAEWDTNHVGYGVPYVVYRCERDDTAWPNGEPTNFRALVKGRKLYDPRKDSTNGGSGSHRVSDASTWEWSQNWALAVRDYISGGAVVYASGTPDKRLGVGEIDSRIDDAYIIAAANTSDESVTVPLPMLPGTIDFTNGIEGLTGYGTQFTRLGLPLYLLAPNGTVVQVGFIGGDTDALLSAPYAGPTADGASVHYATSNVSSTTESRFTCDGQLSCGNVHGENLTVLLSAGIGHLSYVSGKYRLFAGVYTTPTVTLDDDDFLDSVEMSPHPTADQMWNFVTGTFFDEDNDWTQSSFPPQRNTTYESDDGRQYPKAIDLQMTRGNYRAQRIAQVTLNLSRNFIALNAKGCSHKAANASVWDTINVNIAEYGWVNQVLRVQSWTFLSSGRIGLLCSGEGSSAYADPGLGVYVDPSTNNPPAFTLSPPDAPTSLQTSSTLNAVVVTVGLPGFMAALSTIEVWEYTSSSPFSSATKVAEGKQSVFAIQRADSAVRYYWATVRDPSGGRSTNYPSGAGLAGNSVAWTPIVHGNAVANGTTITKVGGTSAWDSDCYPSIAYQNGVSVTWRMPDTTSDVMGGLSANPGGSVSYTSQDLGLHCESGVINIYHAGAALSLSAGTYAAGDNFEVRYDGITGYFFHNGALLFAFRVAGATFTPKMCLHTPGAMVTDFAFNASTANVKTGGNYLSTVPWIVGTSGSQGNYVVSSGGAVVLGGVSPAPLGPYGASEPLWQTAGGSSSFDGGWDNSGDLRGIDSSKTYRSVVWLYWNGVGAPAFYHGPDFFGGARYTCTVGTQTPVSDPYFSDGVAVSGNLTANKWYLAVGILHGSSYTGGSSGISGIYDPATGENIVAGTDFNILAAAPFQTQRVYHYGDTNSSGLMYFGRPRFEEMNGAEPSLAELLSPDGDLAYLDTADTANLAPNAATTVAFGTFASSVTLGTVRNLAAATVVVPTGETWSVQVIANANITLGSSPSGACNLQLDGSTVQGPDGWGSGDASSTMNCPFTYATTLTVGSHTFTVTGFNSSGGATHNFSSVSVSLLKR